MYLPFLLATLLARRTPEELELSDTPRLQLRPATRARGTLARVEAATSGTRGRNRTAMSDKTLSHWGQVVQVDREGSSRNRSDSVHSMCNRNGQYLGLSPTKNGPASQMPSRTSSCLAMAAMPSARSARVVRRAKPNKERLWSWSDWAPVGPLNGPKDWDEEQVRVRNITSRSLTGGSRAMGSSPPKAVAHSSTRSWPSPPTTDPVGRLAPSRLLSEGADIRAAR